MSHFADDDTIELIESLKQQLAEREKQIVMLRTALDMTQWGDFHFDHTGDGQHYCPECGNLKRQAHTNDCPVGIALDSTQDLVGCILCDAEPHAVVRGAPEGKIFKTIEFLVQAGGIPNGTLLYKAKEAK